jgi:hypothetical protein
VRAAEERLDHLRIRSARPFAIRMAEARLEVALGVVVVGRAS